MFRSYAESVEGREEEEQTDLRLGDNGIHEEDSLNRESSTPAESEAACAAGFSQRVTQIGFSGG